MFLLHFLPVAKAVSSGGDRFWLFLDQREHEADMKPDEKSIREKYMYITTNPKSPRKPEVASRKKIDP